MDSAMDRVNILLNNGFSHEEAFELLTTIDEIEQAEYEEEEERRKKEEEEEERRRFWDDEDDW